MSTKFPLIIFSLLTILFLSCNESNKKKGDALNTQQIVSKIEENTKKKITPISQPGKEIYDKYCLACHQANGMGVPGLNPPLVSNPVISEDKEKLIGIVLNGMKGKIEVNGKAYNSYMPPHNFLSDQDIADVLSYVRSNFGSNSDSISLEEVVKVRNKP